MFLIRVYARRAVLGDMSFPFYEPMISEWMDRVQALGVEAGALVIDPRFRVDYLVTDQSTRLACAPSARFDTYSIYSVKDCPVVNRQIPSPRPLESDFVPRDSG